MKQMKPLFKNTTIYNSENYNQFIEFHGKNFSFSYNSYNIIMILLLIYCVVINIIDKNLIFVLLFSVLLGLLVFFRIYWPLRTYEKNKDKYAEDNESSFTFSFYKYYFTLEKKTFYYSKLYKVFETEDYFYLYINDENAILVSKTGFDIGTPEEFSAFIKKKCLLKYSKQQKRD